MRIKPFLRTVLFACFAVGFLPMGPLTAEGVSHFANLEGNRVHYRSFGRGSEALVFLHEAMSDSESWRLQAAAFGARQRVILIDLPGHGQSDKPKIAYTMDFLARAVDVVLRDARVRRAVLIGHSLGAPVARQFYRRYPGKTTALVFVDAALWPLATQERGEEFIRPFHEDYAEAAGNWVNLVAAPTTPPEIRRTIKQNWIAGPSHVTIALLELLFLPNTAPEVWKEDAIDPPVLVVMSGMPYVSPQAEENFRKLSRKLTYRVIPATGHFIMLEKPLEFNQILGEFLQGIGVIRKP